CRRGLSARIPMRQKLIRGRRRRHAGGGNRDRDGRRGVRNVRLPFQPPRDLAPMAETSVEEDVRGGPPHIEVRNLTMAYGSFVLMRDLNFTVRRRDIFVIMGGSGCGKSTLLRHLIGLKEPVTGEILYGDFN